MRKLFFFSVVLIILLLLAVVANYYQLKVKNKTLVNGAQFEVVDCWFDYASFPNGYQPYAWLFGFKIRRIECGYMTTRKEQGESFFRLPVVIIRDSFWSNSDHPVINISGGPGASAWLDEESINRFWLPSIKENDWQYDIVLYDSRATGLSEPALHCDNFFKNTLDLLAKDLQPEIEATLAYRLLVKCHRKLSQDKQKLAALHHLGTISSAHDIADLSGLLSVESWNLYGTSYGTRLALEVARLYPDSVNSIILDSVYPQEVDGEETMPDLYLDAVEGMLSACDKEPTCALGHANLQQKLHAVLQRLQEKPVTLGLKQGDQYVDYVLTPSRFFALLYDAGYDINNVVVVPNAIQSLYAGKYDVVHYLAQSSLDMMLDESFSNPVYMEVECNENEIKDQQAYINNINKKYATYPVLRRWQLAAVTDDFCEVWGSKEVPNSFHQPVITNKPSLILAGQLDSATPAKWGRALAAHLPNSQYHEVKASGHAVLYNVACAKNIVRRFLNPNKNYPVACQSDNPYDNGQRVVWDSPDVGDAF